MPYPRRHTTGGGRTRTRTWASLGEQRATACHTGVGRPAGVMRCKRTTVRMPFLRIACRCLLPCVDSHCALPRSPFSLPLAPALSHAMVGADTHLWTPRQHDIEEMKHNHRQVNDSIACSELSPFALCAPSPICMVSASLRV